MAKVEGGSQVQGGAPDRGASQPTGQSDARLTGPRGGSLGGQEHTGVPQLGGDRPDKPQTLDPEKYTRLAVTRGRVWGDVGVLAAVSDVVAEKNAKKIDNAPTRAALRHNAGLAREVAGYDQAVEFAADVAGGMDRRLEAEAAQYDAALANANSDRKDVEELRARAATNPRFAAARPSDAVVAEVEETVAAVRRLPDELPHLTRELERLRSPKAAPDEEAPALEDPKGTSVSRPRGRSDAPTAAQGGVSRSGGKPAFSDAEHEAFVAAAAALGITAEDLAKGPEHVANKIGDPDVVDALRAMGSFSEPASARRPSGEPRPASTPSEPIGAAVRGTTEATSGEPKPASERARIFVEEQTDELTTVTVITPDGRRNTQTFRGNTYRNVLNSLLTGEPEEEKPTNTVAGEKVLPRDVGIYVAGVRKRLEEPLGLTRGKLFEGKVAGPASVYTRHADVIHGPAPASDTVDVPAADLPAAAVPEGGASPTSAMSEPEDVAVGGATEPEATGQPESGEGLTQNVRLYVEKGETGTVVHVGVGGKIVKSEIFAGRVDQAVLDVLLGGDPDALIPTQDVRAGAEGVGSEARHVNGTVAAVRNKLEQGLERGTILEGRMAGQLSGYYRHADVVEGAPPESGEYKMVAKAPAASGGEGGSAAVDAHREPANEPVDRRPALERRKGLHAMIEDRTSDDIITLGDLLGKGEGESLTAAEVKQLRNDLASLDRTYRTVGKRLSFVRNRGEDQRLNYGVYVEDIPESPAQVHMVGNVLRFTQEDGTYLDVVLATADERRVMRGLASLRSGHTNTTHKFPDEFPNVIGETPVADIITSIKSQLEAAGAPDIIGIGGGDSYEQFLFITGAEVSVQRDNYKYFPVYDSRLQALSLLTEHGRDTTAEQLHAALGPTHGKGEPRQLRPREATEALRHAITNIENRREEGIATEAELRTLHNLHDFIRRSEFDSTDQLIDMMSRRLYGAVTDPEQTGPTRVDAQGEPFNPVFGQMEPADVAILASAAANYRGTVNTFLGAGGYAGLNEEVLDELNNRYFEELPEIPEEERDTVLPKRRETALKRVTDTLADPTAMEQIEAQDPELAAFLKSLGEMNNITIKSRSDLAFQETGLQFFMGLLVNPSEHTNGYYVEGALAQPKDEAPIVRQDKEIVDDQGVIIETPLHIDPEGTAAPIDLTDDRRAADERRVADESLAEFLGVEFALDVLDIVSEEDLQRLRGEQTAPMDTGTGEPAGDEAQRVGPRGTRIPVGWVRPRPTRRGQAVATRMGGGGAPTTTEERSEQAGQQSGQAERKHKKERDTRPAVDRRHRGRDIVVTGEDGEPVIRDGKEVVREQTFEELAREMWEDMHTNPDLANQTFPISPGVATRAYNSLVQGKQEELIADKVVHTSPGRHGNRYTLDAAGLATMIYLTTGRNRDRLGKRELKMVQGRFDELFVKFAREDAAQQPREQGSTHSN